MPKLIESNKNYPLNLTNDMKNEIRRESPKFNVNQLYKKYLSFGELLYDYKCNVASNIKNLAKDIIKPPPKEGVENPEEIR